VQRDHVDYARAVEQDRSEWSELHLAALEGDMDRVVELVDAGADVRAENPGSLWTPLHIAALYDREMVLKYLVETWRYQYDTEPDMDSLLFAAAIHGNHHCVKYLLEEGGDPNGQRSHDFEPQLHVAASHGHLETLKLLLEHGADIDARTPTLGLTALHGAAEKGLPGVQTLVEHGADVDARAANGYTPLHVAAERGHADVAAYLIEHGADADAVTETGRTARDLAVRNDRADVVKTLDDMAAR
jgi:ankyrin repeat protein